MKNKSIVATLGAILAAPSLSLADIQPSALFTDHMVIQRETQAPVWGTAEAGEKVTVTGSWGESVATTADASGKWMVKLKTPAAGGPHTLTLTGNNNVEIKDVLSGEVWFCSGQSNMDFELKQLIKINPRRTEKKYEPAALYVKKEMETAQDGMLRQFKVTKTKSPTKPLDTLSGDWVASSPQTNPGFSGTAYFFGRELRQELNVPIGLIKCAWGGTRVEAWMPADAFPKGQAVKQSSTLLYNGMVNPVIPYAIRGTIWYQGEGNTNNNTEQYQRNFSALINTWRERWGQGDFPFYYAQLANYYDRSRPNLNGRLPEPVEHDGWASVCEQQRRTLDVINTGMAVLHDIGEATDVHPHNKMDVGKRLALWALKNDYNKDISAWSGPLYKSHEIKDEKVIIHFTHAGSGLMSGEKPVLEATLETKKPLTHFQVCGADRHWKWAQAEITGKDNVTVFHAEVPDPVVVRYAWSKNAESANLYNKEGLPASIFSTEAEIPAAPGEVAPAKVNSKSKVKTKTATEPALKKNDRIVFLGDSITQGGAKPGGYVTLTTDAIKKAYPDLGIEVIGAGISGNKVPDCQKRLDRDVLQKKPTIVFIYIGINDVWHWSLKKRGGKGFRKGTTPQKFETGLKDMIAKINAVGARVILCTPTVIGEKPDGTNPNDMKLDEYADISRKVAKDTGSQLLDLRTSFIDHLQKHNPENIDRGILTKDSVHMNEKGNRFLSTQMLKALNVSEVTIHPNNKIKH